MLLTSSRAALLYSLLLSLLSHPISALTISLAEHTHGVIGYGISMYDPVCCYACHDSLSSLYLNCTTFMSDDMGHMEGMKLRKRMDMGGEMAVTSTECRASDPAWVSTIAYCIKDRCTEDGVSEARQAKCYARMVPGRNTVHGTADIVPFQQALPQRAPTVEVADDAEWLNTTSLVNAETYATNKRTLAEFERSEKMHTQYDLIVWLVTVGIPLVIAAWTFVSYRFGISIKSTFSRKLKTHFALPALLNGRQLEPLRWNIGYLPSRPLTAFITLYVILNIIFSCVSYRIVAPNSWYSENRAQISAYVGNRTGSLSFTNLGIAILFAGRNNLLIAVTGWSQTTFLTFHRWAARIAAIQAVVHSIVYTYPYFWSGGAAAYYAEAAKAYYWWGIIATVAVCVMIGFAVLPIRASAYELFLIIHIALAILTLVGCWYHIALRFGPRWGYEVWLYLCFAFWGFDRLVRIVRMGLFNSWSAGSRALVERIPDTEIVQITLFPGARFERSIGPGMHSFLYFLNTGKVWESHPFTIAGWGRTWPTTGIPNADTDGDNSSSSGASLSESCRGEKSSTVKETAVEASPTITTSPNRPSPPTGKFYLRFLLRVQKGSTRSLLHQITDLHHPSPPSTAVTKLHAILTEGPYSGHVQTLHPLLHADTVLCIAGGIGITFTLGFVQHFAAGLKQQQEPGVRSPARTLLGRTSRFVVAWSAREEGLIRHVAQNMLPRRRDDLDVRVWHTGATSTTEPRGAAAATTNVTLTRGARMDIASVLSSTLEEGRKTVVLICAPGGMADAVRREVVGASARGFDVDLVEEAFAW